MALIGKARLKSDMRKRRLGGGEQMACIVDAQMADILAGGAVMVLPEGACEMRRMHTDGGGNRIQREALCEVRVQVVARLLEPAGAMVLQSTAGVARHLCQ